MLLHTYDHHYTDTQFVFSVLSISSPRSIYVISVWSIFHFQPHFHCHITSFKQTHLFFVHFLEHLLLFLDDNVDEESEKFSDSKSSASELLGISLIFWQFQPGVPCKNVVYKKASIWQGYSHYRDYLKRILCRFLLTNTQKMSHRGLRIPLRGNLVYIFFTFSIWLRIF